MGGSCPWSWELGRSCLDLGKIMVRSFCPCNIVVVCVCYGLICSLVTMLDRGTHVLSEQAVHKLCIANLQYRAVTHSIG